MNLFLTYGKQTYTRLNLEANLSFNRFDSLFMQYHILKQLKRVAIQDPKNPSAILK
jgi:hypothetical protein